MPRPEAVFFDFDGVLLDSEPIHYTCWSEVLAPFGITLDWHTYVTTCIGVAEGVMLEGFAKRANPPLDVAELWAQYPAKQACFRRLMTDAPPFPPGLRDWIKTLAKTYRLAVVSSSSRNEVVPMLERGGIHPFLDTVVCGEDVTHHKPAPDPYLLAARRLGVSTALVAEDSEAGLASARAAGFDVVRIPNPSETAALVRARLGDA